MDEKQTPDDVLLYITQFIKPIDCMAFAVARVSRRFNAFFLRRQSKWDLNSCFSMNPELCVRYLSSPSTSSNITSINLSHCFWVPSSILLASLSRLRNLNELHLTDTKLNLTHIQNIIQHCPKIVTLSISVVEKTWSEFMAKMMGVNFKQIEESFKRLTCLKLHVLDASSPEIWLLIFRILRWCINCSELHLELFYSIRGCPLEHRDSTQTVIDFSRKNLYEDLTWMTNLKTLTYNRRGCQGYNDGCLDDWCRWILNELKPKALEHIWMPFVTNVQLNHPQPAVESFCLGLNYQHESSTQLDIEMPQVSRLAGVNFSSFSNLPQLVLLQGHCSSYSELDELCQKHGPRLEHLCFDDESQACRASPATFQCQWALPRLRTLIYVSRCPKSDVLQAITSSCPNLEELHLGRRTSSYHQAIFDREKPDEEAYRNIFALKRLKKLTFSGVEFIRGQFLQQVLQNCSKLQSLHLSGHFDGDAEFHQALCSFLPLARDLRDFRLQREELQDNQLLMLLSSLASCCRLERLVIYQEAWSPQSPSLSALLPDAILRLARLPHLTALCLVYPLQAAVVKTTMERLGREIQSSRRSFWFYLADELPRGTDPSVPRIHFDQIVDPDYCADFFTHEK